MNMKSKPVNTSFTENFAEAQNVISKIQNLTHGFG